MRCEPTQADPKPAAARSLFVTTPLACICVLLAAATCQADQFYYRDADGQPVELEATLVGSEQGIYILETPDGRYHLVPRGAAEKRVASAGPAALDGPAMAARLTQEFTGERFRSYLQEPFVIGLVLGSPLPKASEGAAKAFLRDVAVFLKNVEGAFARYARDARVETPAATHPVVVLIFETREDFVNYAAAATSGDEDIAKRVAGFYSKLTNILAIRLEECRTFDTPLHEAIHQQVYVRKILQRLAPIPTWFDEGLATGFEANGGKINVGPGKISVRYANQALESQPVDWAQLLGGDEAFRAAATVDGAYGQAWGLHWLLVTRYKSEYAAYMRLLGQKKPLQEYPPEQRQADFQQAFGDKLAEMQAQFPSLLEAACRKQNVVLKPPERKGISLTEENLGQVQLTAVRHQTVGAAGLRGDRLEVQGTLLNLSPLRTMAFHVTVETNAATYAEWFIPQLDLLKSAPLPAQNVVKPMQVPAAAAGGIAQIPGTFRVRIRSVPADSDEAKRWTSGQRPVPVLGGSASDSG
jgi:hypothetical protein